MRIRRITLIPAILALGLAGSILAGSAVPAVAAQASAVASSSVTSATYYHW